MLNNSKKDVNSEPKGESLPSFLLKFCSHLGGSATHCSLCGRDAPTGSNAAIVFRAAEETTRPAFEGDFPENKDPVWNLAAFTHLHETPGETVASSFPQVSKYTHLESKMSQRATASSLNLKKNHFIR